MTRWPFEDPLLTALRRQDPAHEYHHDSYPGGCPAHARNGQEGDDPDVTSSGPLPIQNHRHDQDHGNARQHTASVSRLLNAPTPEQLPGNNAL